MLDHLPGPWAITATVASGGASAVVSQVLLDTAHPITVGLGALLAACAAGVWECIARARLERRIRKRDTHLNDDQDAA